MDMTVMATAGLVAGLTTVATMAGDTLDLLAAITLTFLVLCLTQVERDEQTWIF